MYCMSLYQVRSLLCISVAVKTESGPWDWNRGQRLVGVCHREDLLCCSFHKAKQNSDSQYWKYKCLHNLPHLYQENITSAFGVCHLTFHCCLEFQMAIQKDSDRVERMIASLAHPTHPFSNFVWGNSESLKKTPRKKGINVAKRLREHYQRNYSSHYMTVAVMSSCRLGRPSFRKIVKGERRVLKNLHVPRPPILQCSAHQQARGSESMYPL